MSSTDPLGFEKTAVYNLADQTAATAEPATGNTGSGRSSQVTTYLYTGGPFVRFVKADEAGTTVRTVDYTYGLEGEALSRTGSAEQIAMTYDAAYAVRTVADGGGTTSYVYDTSGRKTEVDSAGATGLNYGRVRYTSYDASDRALSRTDGNGQLTNYAYNDLDGLLSDVTYPGATANNVSLHYDAYGRVDSLADAAGTSTTTYDDAGNATSATRTYTGLSAMTQTFTYYHDGSRNTMTNVADTWTYGYDANGRCTSTTTSLGTASSTYYDNGWESSRTLPNGVTTSYGYNAVGHLASLTNAQPSTQTVLSQFSNATYDGAFNLAGYASQVPQESSTAFGSSFSHDSRNRLVAESSGRGAFTGSYAYDLAGNSTSFKGVAGSFNTDNQRTGSGFAYDGNGNPSTYRGAAMSFDPENRAVGLNGVSAGYRVDGLRAWKQDASGARTYYLYDGNEPIIELSISGAVKAFNVFAPDGLVSRQQQIIVKPAGANTNGLVRFAQTQYTFDPLGNVAQRLDSSGGVKSSSTYRAYGAESSVGNPTDAFGYNAQWGYYLDRETCLYLCGHRYYDVAAGRWINRDPIGTRGGIDLYAYCNSSPTGLVDMDGHGSQLNPAFGPAMADALAPGGDAAEALAEAAAAAVAGAAAGAGAGLVLSTLLKPCPPPTGTITIERPGPVSTGSSGVPDDPFDPFQAPKPTPGGGGPGDPIVPPMDFDPEDNDHGCEGAAQQGVLQWLLNGGSLNGTTQDAMKDCLRDLCERKGGPPEQPGWNNTGFSLSDLTDCFVNSLK